MTTEEIYEVYTQFPHISTDTRKELKGTLFFCLKGPNFNANSFAEKAIEKGAALVVSDDKLHSGKKGIAVVDDGLKSLQDLAKYHRSKFGFPVIGLTGSNGKTTNKELISSVLKEKYKTYFTKGNLNNHIGVPLTILEIPLDAEMAVVEMGANHIGEIEALCNISDPDCGLITNIGKAHLEGFGGIEGVKKGKSELYRHIKDKDGTLFVNGDDPVLMELSEGGNRIFFGSNSSFLISGKLEGFTEFVSITYTEDEFNSELIKTKLVGKYNFYNILAAICIGRFFDVSHEEIKRGLENYTPSNNRSQLQITNKNQLILDAYNANPTSMLGALENLEHADASNKIALLGQMMELGETSREEHQNLINTLREKSLKAFLVGDKYRECETYEFQVFTNSEELYKYLKSNPIIDHLILLKGSRSVQMEKVVPLL